ncbi:MAG: hypothetical protein A2W31_07575 [Planctomycetes bacterium RBG_16_64_10]|nr:MAG: hypothetical protein A2W31_07575 [Planctomycetes bacterium RBG_16_64_10]
MNGAYRAIDWFRARLGTPQLGQWLRHKQVPWHRHSVWYLAGGAILFFLVVQVVTGILLAFYYRPTVDEANASVRRIVGEIPRGWIVRSMHHWGSSFMIGMVFVHTFSTWLSRSYRPPRELIWISGVVLLLVALGFGFTGYLLPWDELSVAATKVGTDLPAALPLVGRGFTRLLRGGDQVTGDTLGRFFVAHVCLLPLASLLLLIFHVGLVQKEGISTPRSVEGQGRSIPFWPNFFYREAAVWVLLGGGLITVAALLPPPVGVQADLLAPAPEGIRPEWYFLFVFQGLKVLPAQILSVSGETIAVSLMLLVGIAVLLLPILDRRPEPRTGQVLAWLAIAFITAMTLWSFL